MLSHSLDSLLRCYAVLFLFLLSQSAVWAQSQSYRLGMPEPHTHYYEVTITISDYNKNEAIFELPVWIPGSYMVREYAKNVESVVASSGNKSLKVEKLAKNRWKVSTEGQKNFDLNYRVYAYELSVRTSFLDASHAYINGTSVFMYLVGMAEKPSKLIIEPFKEFKNISTSLKADGSDKWTRLVPNYDVLADSPIEIGNHDILAFKYKGIPHEIALYGGGNYDPKKLVKDFERCVDVCTEVFKENPCENYVFIVHNTQNGGGGLEHLNSTSVLMSRLGYANPDSYRGFLGLIIHEYFHLWNVKRLRPKALGPFDYNQENYTSMLWVAEGITSYYDELLSMRAGYNDHNGYLNTLCGSIGTIENRFGRRVQPVTESSFDAWIKFYRADENSANATVSYYTYGSILGALLDLELLGATNGEKGLDELMRELYLETYKKQNKGYTDEEFKEACEKMAGKKMTDFFEQYVGGTTVPDYNRIFGYAGLELKQETPKNVSLGCSLDDTGGKLLVKNVYKGGAGYADGLNVNDEIIAVNDFRTLSRAQLSEILLDKKENDVLKILVARGGVLLNLSIKLKTDINKVFFFESLNNPSVTQMKIRSRWLMQMP